VLIQVVCSIHNVSATLKISVDIEVAAWYQ